MAQKYILAHDTARRRAVAAVSHAPAGWVVTVKEPTRSGEQNAKFWAVLTDLSRAKPEGRCHTPETWKQLVMHAAGHEVQFLAGLDGNPFPAGFRSSRMTKAQMSECIEYALAYGEERGVEWSEPDTQQQRSAA